MRAFLVLINDSIEENYNAVLKQHSGVDFKLLKNMMGNPKNFIPDKFMKYDVVKHHHEKKVNPDVL